MPAAVALLRGVNVVGHNRIGMNDLRTVCSSLGLGDVRTFIQSGNVVFTAAEKDLAGLEPRIADAIAGQFGFKPEVILRTRLDLRRIVSGNPFADRRDIEPQKLLVGFLASKPSDEAREKFVALDTSPEEPRLVGRELYVYYPNGVGRSKLAWATIERTLKTPATGRNWNTVLKLLEMLEMCGRG